MWVIRILTWLAMLYFWISKLWWWSEGMSQLWGAAPALLPFLWFLSNAVRWRIATIGEILAWILLISWCRILSRSGAILTILIMIFAWNAVWFNTNLILVTIWALAVLACGPWCWKICGKWCPCNKWWCKDWACSMGACVWCGCKDWSCGCDKSKSSCWSCKDWDCKCGWGSCDITSQKDA